MTTVTERQKRLLDDHDRASLARGTARMREDPELATRFAGRLVDLAHTLVPERRWTLEELREAFEIATRAGPEVGARSLEGRHLRKRLAEQCALAQQYGDGFGCVVLSIASDVRGAPAPAADADRPGAIEALVREVGAVLRRSDLVFPFRRRVFLLLPRVRRTAFPALVDRLHAAVVSSRARRDARARSPALPDEPDVEWAFQFFGGEAGVAVADVLDWAEDRLRDA